MNFKKISGLTIAFVASSALAVKGVTAYEAHKFEKNFQEAYNEASNQCTFIYMSPEEACSCAEEVVSDHLGSIYKDHWLIDLGTLQLNLECK